MPHDRSPGRTLHAFRARPFRALLVLFWSALAGGGALLLLSTVMNVRELVEHRAVLTLPDIAVEAGALDHAVPRNLFGGEAVVEVATHTPPAADRVVKPFSEAIARMARSGGNVVSATPYVLLSGVLRNGSHVQPVDIQGIDPMREKAAPAPFVPTPGLLDALQRRSDGILIGMDAARTLGALVGRTIQLVTPAGDLRTLTVAGTFRVGVPGFDRERCYVQLPLAQSLRGLQEDAVTGLSVRLRSAADADAAASAIERGTGYDAKVRAALAAPMFDHERWERYAALGLSLVLLLTIPFVVTAVLIPGLVDARREGAGSPLLSESFSLGAVGGFLAIVVGIVAAAILDGRLALPLTGVDGAISIEPYPLTVSGLWIGAIFVSVLLLSMTAAPLAAVAVRRGRSVAPIREEA